MEVPSDDGFSRDDLVQYSSPGKFVEEAEPKTYYCPYCFRAIQLLPHEFRLCQAPACLRRAIEDRDERIFEIQLAIPKVLSQLVDQNRALLETIAELESRDGDTSLLAQYKSVLTSLNANLGFAARNERIDQILALKEQIKELSKRLARPRFSDEVRRRLWKRDRRLCYLCQSQVDNWDGNTMHIDHVRPRSQGGSDEPYNLRIAHAVCNLRKGDRELAARCMRKILAELRRSDEDDLRNRLF